MKQAKKRQTTPDSSMPGIIPHKEKLQGVQDRQQESTACSLCDHTDWILEGWRQERPDLDVSPVAIINRLERLTAYLRAEIAVVYERFGLTGPSFAVLATLRRAGTPYQLSQRALMDALQLT